jgi:trans-2,3-dihydro-3-hydroxyanthranilate isomerase
VTDDDHDLTVACGGFADIVRRRAGDQSIVDLELDATRYGNRGGSLAGAQQRARDHGIGLQRAELDAESVCGFMPFGGKRPQRIRFSGRGLCMADEDQAHAAKTSYRQAMRRFRYVVADVFTDTALAGNQLAVFTDARDLDSLTMQALARELAFSETVFVLRPQADDADVRIRIFTPTRELPFAGHPTLGSAFVLGGPLQKIVLRIETGAGVIPVELEREGPKIVFGWMEQPIPKWELFDRTDELLAALGVSTSGLPVEVYDLGPTHAFVELDSPGAVAALEPDLAALVRVTSSGVSCFARAGNGWKTRVFVPAHGVPEDPATGSAAGPLAIHLARHGRTGFGEEIEISQGVELGRPSRLYARVDGSADAIDRVLVGGSAVIVARGEFSLP